MHIFISKNVYHLVLMDIILIKIHQFAIIVIIYVRLVMVQVMEIVQNVH